MVVIAHWHDSKNEVVQVAIGVGEALTKQLPNISTKTILDWLLQEVEGGRGGGKGEIILAGGFSHAVFIAKQAALQAYVASLLTLSKQA